MAQSVEGVELCAGTAVTGLSALCGAPVQPITGYMGGKRRWAAPLARWALGKPDHLHLVDGGPWGQVWSVYAAGRGLDLAEQLHGIAERYPFAPDLWVAMASEPPFRDPISRAAQYLAIQARSVSCVPVWWSGTRWEGPTGSRRATPEKIAAQRGRGTKAGQKSSKHKRHACDAGPAYQAHGGAATAGRPQMPHDAGPAYQRPLNVSGVGQKRDNESTNNHRGGLLRSATLAERALALATMVPWHRVTVYYGRVEDFSPIPGSRVYFDPPFLGAPRYALELPRLSVLDVCERHAAVASSVAVSESEPLQPVGAWRTVHIADGEMITFTGLSEPPFVAPAHQMRLFGLRRPIADDRLDLLDATL